MFLTFQSPRDLIRCKARPSYDHATRPRRSPVCDELGRRTSDRKGPADSAGYGFTVPAAGCAREPSGVRPWALRWLARWASEHKAATIEQAAEIAASLADLPAEPSMFETIREAAT